MALELADSVEAESFGAESCDTDSLGEASESFVEALRFRPLSGSAGASGEEFAGEGLADVTIGAGDPAERNRSM